MAPQQQTTQLPKDDLVLRIVAAHTAFGDAFRRALLHARDAGECLLSLRVVTGLEGVKLFDLVREEAGVSISDRTLYMYQRLASRWNELRVIAAERLDELSLTQAVKLLQDAKPPKASPAAQPEAGTATQEVVADSVGGDELPPKSADKPIIVQQPFDQPVQDRLASVFAGNGPASTPIQVMTSLVIPSLRRVAGLTIGDTDVPFLAAAIQEALLILEGLQKKYVAN